MAAKRQPRFALSIIQISIALLSMLALIVISIFSVISTNKSLKISLLTREATSQFVAATEARRQIFVYEVRFSQWTNGEIPKSDVVDAGYILKQRLAAINGVGSSLAQKINPELTQLLQSTENLINQSSSGYLPVQFQKKWELIAKDLVDGLTNQAQNFAQGYRVLVDQEFTNYSDAERSSARWVLYRFLIWLVFSFMVLLWIATTFRRQFKASASATLASQQRLDQAREELEAAHETVETLQKINESKTDFVTTLNHELRTPLTSIIGYIEILKDFKTTSDNSEFHKYLSVMDRNAAMLTELIESILFLSALDNQDSLPEESVLDLVDLCEASISEQVLAIKTSGIKVRTYYEDDQYFTVLGNRTLLSQVFTNLISNAIKFSPDKSRISISFSRGVRSHEEQFIRVEVKDQGFGIPPQDLPNLFTKFYRASNALGSEIPGTGLGLAIVKRILELHHGKISALSTEGEGTAMIIELPFAISSLEEMIMGKREEVLERAIKSLEEADEVNLVDLSHEVGGAIGFYTFVSESKQLIGLSRWLLKNPRASITTIRKKKVAILEMLNESLDEVKRGREH